MKFQGHIQSWPGLVAMVSLTVVLGAATCGPRVREREKSQTRTELAKDFLGRQELERAELEASKAVELDAQNGEAHLVLGLVDYLKALNNFRILEVENCLTGVEAEALRTEFEDFLQAADSHFARAVEVDNDYSEAHANRGNVATLLEDHSKAIEHYERALRKPHRLLRLGLTRANLGWARFHAGDHVGAAKELRQALQFNDQMCVGKYRMGRVYFARKEWNKALEAFQAVASTKSCPMQEAHLYRVKTLRALARQSEIESAIDACTALASSSCMAVECQTGM